MALALTLRRKVRLGRIWKLWIGCAFSGTYPTNGETISFAAAQFALNQSNRNRTAKPLSVVVTTTNIYTVQYVPGATRDVGKLLCRDGAGAEHTAAAYNASLSGDTNIVAVVELDA